MKLINSQSFKCYQLGVTLVELLVSMLIAGIIFAGVIQTLLDNKRMFLLNEQLAVIQENARFAIEEIGRDVRIAGFTGCSVLSNVANTINVGVGGGYFGELGIEGWDSSEGAAAFPAQFNTDLWTFSDGAKSDPDAFVIRATDPDEDKTYNVTTGPGGHNSNSAAIPVNGIHSVDSCGVMAIVTPDCSQIAIFQHTGNSSNKLNHNTGTCSPGNCTTKRLFGDFDCNNTAPGIQQNLPSGTKTMSLISNAYYIGRSSVDPSIPALYREELANADSSKLSEATELLIGVENMQLQYGIDTNNNGQANTYVPADQVSGVAPLVWSNIVSLRVSLLLRSLNEIWPTNTVFSYNGESYSDRFMRQRVITTIQLRNKGL